VRKIKGILSSTHTHTHHSVQILPLENSNGRDVVEKGQLCERKNGRGVDTNRNWAVDWGKKEKDYSAAEENPGPGPFRYRVCVRCNVCRDVQDVYIFRSRK